MADKETETRTKEEIDREEAAAKAAVDEAGKKAKEKAEEKGASPEEVNEAVERARKEEKDKLYPQIESLKNDLKEIQKILKAERDDKEKIKKEAEEQAERERQSKLSETEKTQEVLNRLEEQLKNERAEREKFRSDLEDRERKSELRRYRERLIEAHEDEIIPELVGGNSVEEIDDSLEVAKARFKELEEKLSKRRGAETRRNMPRSTNPDYLEALEEEELSQDLTALDQDKYLSDPDYRAKIQAELANEYARAAGRK